MNDKSDAYLGENSREAIAFKLFEMIAAVEKKSTSATDESGIKAGWTKADKAYILKTYGECITTVRDGWYQSR
jgi:bacillopeptidase F (M6 metalloprotease family)